MPGKRVTFPASHLIEGRIDKLRLQTTQQWRTTKEGPRNTVLGGGSELMRQGHNSSGFSQYRVSGGGTHGHQR